MSLGPAAVAAMLAALGLVVRVAVAVRRRRAAGAVVRRLRDVPVAAAGPAIDGGPAAGAAAPARSGPGPGAPTRAVTELGEVVLRRLLPPALPPAAAVPVDAVAARCTGFGVLLAAAVPFLGPVGALPAAAFVAAGWRRARRPPAAAEPTDTLPEVLDLLGVAARAGLPVLAALGAVAGRAPPPWRDALAAVDRRAARGEHLLLALDALRAVGGDSGARVAAVLGNAAVDGGDLARDLAHLAADAREVRRRRAEQAARRVPVRLLAPLVTCSLPAFALLTVVPAAVGALAALEL